MDEHEANGYLNVQNRNAQQSVKQILDSWCLKFKLAYLLVHVIEKFPATILVDNTTVHCLARENQMPMPMVKIDAHVFTEVPQTMFFIKIRSSEFGSSEKYFFIQHPISTFIKFSTYGTIIGRRDPSGMIVDSSLAFSKTLESMNFSGKTAEKSGRSKSLVSGR